MKLRSFPGRRPISSDPDNIFWSLRRLFDRDRSGPARFRCRFEDFVRYGVWFPADGRSPDLDTRYRRRGSSQGGRGFWITLDDGQVLQRAPSPVVVRRGFLPTRIFGRRRFSRPFPARPSSATTRPDQPAEAWNGFFRGPKGRGDTGGGQKAACEIGPPPARRGGRRRGSRMICRGRRPLAGRAQNPPAQRAVGRGAYLAGRTRMLATRVGPSGPFPSAQTGYGGLNEAPNRFVHRVPAPSGAIWPQRLQPAGGGARRLGEAASERRADRRGPQRSIGRAVRPANGRHPGHGQRIGADFDHVFGCATRLQD